MCRAPQRGLCWEKIHTKMRESTAAASVEGGMWELFAGEWSSKSQPVTKTEKKNYVGWLFREKVFYLHHVEMLCMGFCTPKRNPGTQVNRSLVP